VFWVLNGFTCQVYPILTINQWLFVLFLVFCWGFCGLFLGFVWWVTKDVAGLLFLLRRDGRFYRSRLASVTVYASPSPFSDERPSSRFRGIALPSKRRRLRYSTVGLTRYRTR